MAASAHAKCNSARDIFAAAVKLVDAARQTFIALACEGDDNLLAEVQALLDADAQAGHALDKVEARLVTQQPPLNNATTETFITDSCADDDGTDARLDVSKHPRIGPYTIREQIGEGGMGYVYVAEQTHPVRRKVALKVIKPGMDTKEVIARFEAERQALAMMSHPNIARVLDAGAIGGGSGDSPLAPLGGEGPGVRGAGRPYFVMELVRGVPITTFCDQQKLTTRERLELFLQVCGAVQHAHMKGIIHRDLKPSNVIVELHDVKPVPKVIDFGVAKATGERLTQHTLYTPFSQLVGTPLYMSPEQAKQSALDIDTRSDIYSLGVMLYELLTGTTPFDKQTLSSVDLTELQRIICEDDPPRPSLRISTLKNEQLTTISASRKTEPRQLGLSMQRELDWIVMKALEKDRTRRYESASAFAADIQRYLDDEPVQACPPTVGYRLRKYARRHKGLLTTAAIVVGMLITSTIVSAAFAVQSQKDEKAAEQAEQAARDAQTDAEEEKKIAEQRLERAVEVVDTMLTRVADERLSATPGTAAIREELLRDALTFYEDFLEEAHGSIEIKRRMADVHLKRARIYWQLNDSEKRSSEFHTALDLYEAILSERPDDLQAIIGVANIRKRAADEFIESADERAESRRRAISLLENAFDEHKDDNEFREALTGAYSDQLLTAEADGDMETLRRYRQRLERLLNEWDTISGTKRAEALCAIGSFEAFRLYSPGDVAVAYFRKATQADETWDFAQLMLGLFLRWRGDAREAETCFWRAIELEREQNTLNPTTMVSANFNLAHKELVELIMSRHGAAQVIDELTARIEHGESTIRDFLLRSDLYRRTGNSDAALADIEQVYPLKRDGLAAALYFNALSANERHADAVAVLKNNPQWSAGARVIQFSAFNSCTDPELREQLLELLDEADQVPWEVRAEWFLDLAEYDRSLPELNEYLARHPDNSFTHKRRALALFHLGNYPEALADIRKSIELQANDLSVLWWIPLPLVVKCPDEEFRNGFLESVDETVRLNNSSIASLKHRAEILVEFGDFVRAQRDLDAVVNARWKKGLRDYSLLYQTALVSLATENPERYRTLCQRMLAAFAESQKAMETQFTAWTCALAPDALEDYSVPLALAESAVAAEPENQQYLNSLGAVQLRAGLYEEALATFDRVAGVAESNNTSRAYDFYFRAMAEHRLDRSDAARQSLAKANELAAKELDGNPVWNRKLTLELLRAEAESLIGPVEEPDDDDELPPPPPQTIRN